MAHHWRATPRSRGSGIRLLHRPARARPRPAAWLAPPCRPSRARGPSRSEAPPRSPGSATGRRSGDRARSMRRRGRAARPPSRLEPRRTAELRPPKNPAPARTRASRAPVGGESAPRRRPPERGAPCRCPRGPERGLGDLPHVVATPAHHGPAVVERGAGVVAPAPERGGRARQHDLGGARHRVLARADEHGSPPRCYPAASACSCTGTSR